MVKINTYKGKDDFPQDKMTPLYKSLICHVMKWIFHLWIDNVAIVWKEFQNYNWGKWKRMKRKMEMENWNKAETTEKKWNSEMVVTYCCAKSYLLHLHDLFWAKIYSGD